ncbi:hypothetical protein MKX01_023569 [Papaver californicum]|nr:hypothetical protein MKX01_023569 [Papaver californicum]
MKRNDVRKNIEPQVANEVSCEHVIAVAELARKCLNEEGKHRPTMKQVAAELETLSKFETPPSGVHNQHSHEKMPNVFIDEPRDLYSVPINSYTSDDSSQYSNVESEFSLINRMQ